jgi:hypothetical protein
MKFKFLSSIALAAAVITGLGIAFGSIAVSQAQPVASRGGALSVAQLGEALTPYGKNTTTRNGETSYSITVPRGNWKFNIVLNISPNGQVIWMTDYLSPVPDAGKVSSGALLNVLKKNSDIGPAFFEIAHGSLAMTKPVPNWGLDAATMKAIVDNFVSTMVDNAALWDPATLAGK